MAQVFEIIATLWATNGPPGSRRNSTMMSATRRGIVATISARSGSVTTIVASSVTRNCGMGSGGRRLMGGGIGPSGSDDESGSRLDAMRRRCGKAVERPTTGTSGPAVPARPTSSRRTREGRPMSAVILLTAVVAALAVALAYVRATEWLREQGTTRYVFEDRDTYVLLRVDHPLGGDERGLVSMLALREALKLKLSGVGYKRVLVDISGLRIANERAFWYLVGALGPALRSEGVKLAVACGRRSRAAKHLRQSAILQPFPSAREAERYLRSSEAARRASIDPAKLDVLLTPGGRRAA